jgi:hypothetical protein
MCVIFMKNRFLVAVVLQLLTLNLLVQASLRFVLPDVSSFEILSSKADSDHQQDQVVPPIEEGDREAHSSESEDDLSFAHNTDMPVLIPLFCFQSLVHPDQQALEGSSLCLLKPPTGMGFKI